MLLRLCQMAITSGHMAKPLVPHPSPEEARLESSVALYRTTPGPAEVLDHWVSVLHQLGFKTSAKVGSPFQQVRAALRHGVPRSAFERIRDDLGVSTDELADVLGIPSRTLARRTERFKPDESERLLRLGSVMQKAVGVFENKLSARRWLTEPKIAFGGLTPLRCCDTEMGAREVEMLLGRIEHGVFS